MKNFTNIIILIALIVFTSCSHDGRKVKKMISRMNAKEFDAASKYIYPGDHPKLYLYSLVSERSPNTYLKLIDKENITVDGDDAVAVKLRYYNPNKFYTNYMEDVTNIGENNTIIDTFWIRQIDGDEYISFEWANIDSESLKSATVGQYSDGLKVMSGVNEYASVIGELDRNEKIIIDDYSEHDTYVKSISVDHRCKVVEGYVDKRKLNSEYSEFFTLDLFGGLGLLLSATILLVLVVIPFFLAGFIGAMFGSIPTLVGAVIGIIAYLYMIYQILENIMFELFIINLPY